MANEVATRENRAPSTQRNENSLAAILDQPRFKQRFTDVLGQRAPQFISSLLSVANAPHLKDAEPMSVIAAAMTAASLDLPINPNLGFAHIVPYKQHGTAVAQFQMGYKGFVQLAMRTGQYRFINACEVLEGELVRYDKLTGELVLNQDAPKPGAKVVGYASYFRLLNGFEHALYMTAEECEEHARRYSKSYSKGYGSVWKDDFDSMALKTVIKLNLSKWGVLSVQMEKALFEDQGMRRNLDAEVVYPDNGTREIPRAQLPPAAGNGAEAAPEKPAKGRKKKAEVAATAPAAGAAEEEQQMPTAASQVLEKLKASGYTVAQFLAVMINVKFIDEPEGDLNEVPLDVVPEHRLQIALDNWEDMEGHLKQVAEKAAAASSKGDGLFADR